MENSNNQGKRPEQYKDSAKFAWYGVVGMIIILLLTSLLMGCATTQPTKKCCEKTHVITETDGDRTINWYSTKEKK
tara:strand:- start:319 stop:546 length:228 start_codon:yes stop_codon:yes gene_type:complete